MDFCVGEKCNNRCLMCTNPDSPWQDSRGIAEKTYSLESLQQRLLGLKTKLPVNEPIIFTGGEPTIHSQFLELLRFTRSVFPKNELRVLTNGRRFFYPDFAKEVLGFGYLNIAVSLCGPNSQNHDKITRVEGSFGQTIQGLKNLLRYRGNGQSIEIRTVISKLSYRHLANILTLIQNDFSQADRVIIIFMEIEGQAQKNFKRAGLTYGRFKPYFKKIIPFFNKLPELQLYHFPLCVVEPRLWPFIWRTLPKEEVAFVRACSGCRYKKYCLGIHKNYLKMAGGREFKPVRRKLRITEKEGDYFHPILEVNYDS